MKPWEGTAHRRTSAGEKWDAGGGPSYCFVLRKNFLKNFFFLRGKLTEFREIYGLLQVQANVSDTLDDHRACVAVIRKRGWRKRKCILYTHTCRTRVLSFFFISSPHDEAPAPPHCGLFGSALGRRHIVTHHELHGCVCAAAPRSIVSATQGRRRGERRAGDTPMNAGRGTHTT